MRPRFVGRQEVPVREVKFADGISRWYGSGRVVYDTWDGSMSISLPIWVKGNTCGWAVDDVERKRAAAMLRKIHDGLSQGPSGAPTHGDRSAYPCILEYLTEAKYPDGSPRETSSLVVVADPTSWRVCLSDRDNSRVMWKTGATLQEALDAIELGLMGDDPSEWRRSSQAAGKGRKRG